MENVIFANLKAARLRVLPVAGLITVASAANIAAEPPSHPSKASGPERAKLVENYGRLPLSFEANTGQADKSVKFLSRGSGYGLYLTDREAVLALQKGGCAGGETSGMGKVALSGRQSAPRGGRGACTKDGAVVRMRLVGASGKNDVPVGEGGLPGTANYFIGNDPAKWHTSVPTFAKVRYGGVYSGVDLEYYGNQRQLEYDFVVAPGANPKRIQLRFSGEKDLRLGADGDLVVTAAGGSLAFQKPRVYQLADGKRISVEATYALLNKHTVSFRLGNYDRQKVLVIDPVLVYSTYLGGSIDDAANGVAVDSAGNAYLAGYTFSTDFPVTKGAFQATNSAAVRNGENAFVTKFDSTATSLVYSTYLGGSGPNSYNAGDGANGLVVDSNGNAYIIGWTESTNFPVTNGAFQTTMPGPATGFVTKLNPSGTALLYSTYLGGNNPLGDLPLALTVDASGSAYVAGSAYSTNFPVTQGAFQTTNHGSSHGSNAYVTKLNATGSALVYSTYLGGSGFCYGICWGDSASAIALDASGDVYLTGTTTSLDFPVTPGVFQSTNLSYERSIPVSFVSKLNNAGTALIYSTYLGSEGYDEAKGIAVDASGNAYVTGFTESSDTNDSPDFPATKGAFQTKNKSYDQGNAFVSKVNSTGTGLIYSTFLGGSVGDVAAGVAVDGAGNAYIVGSSSSPDFPVTNGAFQTVNHSSDQELNAFFTKLNADGSALTYSTYLGGSGFDEAFAIALDSSGNVYIAGQASSDDFPVTPGAFQLANNAANNSRGNAFVAKLDLNAIGLLPPTVAVTTSSASIMSSQLLIVTVAVGGGTGNPTPTGSVTLTGGGYSPAATTLESGSASITIPAGSLTVGSDTLTAIYTPDSNSSSTYSTSTGSASVTVTIPATATPIFSPPAGSYSSTQTVTISDTTPSATIYYTTNGITPTSSSTVYSGPIIVSSSETIEAFATASGYSNSAVAIAAYPINMPIAATPTFSPAAGTYSSTQTITISDSASGATIYYTTDGSTPTTFSTKYTGAITALSNEVINAIAVAPGYANSVISNETYFIIRPSALDADEWTWIGGGNSIPAALNGSPGIYGTPSAFGPGNTPGSRSGSASWTDGNGNLWLLGGWGFDSAGASGLLNDLWEYSPSKSEWSWVGGANTIQNTGSDELGGSRGVYGTLQTPASSNLPGSRQSAVSWTDKNGDLWLFGGVGYDSAGTIGALNDLWMFSPSSGMWTWIGGSNLIPASCNVAQLFTSGPALGNGCGQSGKYGSLITPASGNSPGGRELATGWVDAAGNLWLFGGYGFDSAGDGGGLNDLWEFNVSTKQWAWMSGSDTQGNSGVHGTLGVSAASNSPGNRTFAVSWTDSTGNLWLFGGQVGAQLQGGGNYGLLNDYWMYTPSGNQWTWMGGNNGTDVGGTYGIEGLLNGANVPGSRLGAVNWSDGLGDFWLFGGYGFINEAAGGLGYLNDLWGYSPTFASWAWMSGTEAPAQSGSYGSLGIAAASNAPGSRALSAAWVDSKGNLWLFGGIGYDSNGVLGNLNDLWEYNSPVMPEPCATPTFSPIGGNYTSTQKVTISDSTTGATIYYTTNSTAPTISSTIYSGPITVSSTETIEAMAVASGYSTSAVATVSYIVTASAKTTPTLAVTPASLSITTAQSLSVTVAVNGTPTPTGSVTLTGGGFTSTATTLTSGSATISIPAGSLSAGSDTLTATYKPDSNSSSTYNSAMGTSSAVTVTQPKATPTVTVTPASSSISTAQSLLVTVVVSGVSGNPTPTGTLTLSSGSFTSGITSLSAGTATITVPAGSLGLGSDTITANYSGDNNYIGGSGSSSPVTVTQATQTINFATIPTQSVGTPLTLSATASSGLAVSFTSATTGICTVSGTTATFIASGTCTIDANQAGNTNYAAAAEVQQSFTVNSEGQTITFANPGTQTVGTPLMLFATASSGLAVSFTSATATICTVSGATATFIGMGTCTIDANQPGNTTYAPAPLVEQSFTVNPQPSFGGGGGNPTLNIEPGATTGNTVTITVTPSNGFTGAVNLTCSITPVVASDPPTCTLTPSSVMITGSAAQTSTLTIFTTAATSSRNELKKLLWPTAGTALALLLFGIPRRRRSWLTMLGVLSLVVSIGVIGCGGGGGNSGGGGGGGGNPGTSAGTYSVTVTGTSGSITGTVGTVTLTID